jgi:deoxyadenosine/deoxycytidine kinase
MSLVVDRIAETQDVYTIQGNIGSGKTTLITELEVFIDSQQLCALKQPLPLPPSEEGRDLFLILHEPVQQWCVKNCSLLNVHGEGTDKKLYSFLELFYMGMKKPAVPESMMGSIYFFGIAFTLLGAVMGACIGAGVGSSQELLITGTVLVFRVILALIVGAILGLYIGVLLGAGVHVMAKHAPKIPESTMNPYALDFQLFTFTTRLENLCHQLAKLPKFDPACNVRVHVISERSLRADRLFFKNVYESGAIPEYQWQVYEQLHRTVCGATLKNEDGMIRVNTSAAKCYERMYTKRQREAEVSNGVSLDYLQSLEKQHNDMYASFVSEKGKDKLIDVNFEKDLTKAEIAAIAADLIATIKKKSMKK